MSNYGQQYRGSVSYNDYNYDNSSSNKYGELGNKVNSILQPTLKGYNQYQSTGKTPWSAIASAGKGIYNVASGKNDKNYSDTEESIIYPLQGAAAGSNFGPWGALGGALYGLGYSFKDDIGLKDSNFFTQLLFPIDMGDGGGLQVNGSPIFSM